MEKSQLDKDPTRVLISTPVFEYHSNCIKQFLSAVNMQTYQNFDLLLVDNSPDTKYASYLRSLGAPVIRVPFTEMMRDRTVRSRNLIRNILLEGDYTHLLFLDQDVILPPDGLEKLLCHNLDIASGVYCKNAEGKSYAMVVLEKTGREKGEILVTPQEDLPGDDLFQIAGAGFGCLLITRRVLVEVPFRYEIAKGGDMCFSSDIHEAGFKIFCDRSLFCNHMYIDRNFEKNPAWGYW